VCSIVTASGTASRSGSTLTVTVPTAGTTTVAYDVTTCPAP
jgi:hypothetical protein